MLTLNDKELSTWYDGDNIVVFKLLNLTLADAWDWAKTLSGEDLVISQDGTERQRYGGYDVTSVGIDGDSRIVMRCLRALDPDTEAAITALEANVATAQATADSAAVKADEAKATAQTAAEGANPQVATFARMQLPAMAATMTDEQAISVSTLWPEWSADSVSYKVDDVVQHADHLWRCEQAHTSQESWTPDAAPSLWSQIDIAGDGVDVWTQPTGAHNAYNVGDRVHYPTASDPIYVSTIDGNVWSPDAYPQGWQLEEAE